VVRFTGYNAVETATEKGCVGQVHFELDIIDQASRCHYVKH